MTWVVIAPPWLFVTWLIIDLVVATSVAILEGGDDDYYPPSNSASTYVSTPVWQAPEDGRPMTWQTCNAVYEIEMQLKRVASRT